MIAAIETISEWRRKDDGVTFYSVARRDRVEVARAEVWRETGESQWRAKIMKPNGYRWQTLKDTCKLAMDAAFRELGDHLLSARSAAETPNSVEGVDNK